MTQISQMMGPGFGYPVRSDRRVVDRCALSMLDRGAGAWACYLSTKIAVTTAVIVHSEVPCSGSFALLRMTGATGCALL